MKKVLVLLLLVLLIVCCAACGGPKEVAGMSISVNICGEDLPGTFTGVINEKVPNGNGTFTYSGESITVTYSGLWENGKIANNGNLDYQGMAIEYDDEKYTGSYSGEAMDGRPNGMGSFISSDATKKFEYSGCWENGNIAGSGELIMDCMKVEYGENTYVGAFSGEVLDGVPHGNGTFDVVPDSDYLNYEGYWENGEIAGTGKLKNKQFFLDYCQKSYTGSFDGEVEDGIPNGLGSFTATLENGYLNYNGKWRSGAFFGEGSLESSEYAVTFSDGTVRIGEYKGEVLDGQASGQGVFITQNDAGVTYTHEGEWENGVPNGYGCREWESSEYYTLEGNYVNGDFIPTPVEFFVAEGTYADRTYTIIEKANDFLTKNPNVFLTNDISEYTGELDKQFQYKAFAKNQTQYGDKLIVVSNLQVVQIMERNYWGADHTFCILEDSNYNVYYVNLYGFADDIYEGSRVTLTALPLDYFTYPNVAGEDIWAIACAGAIIK